MIQLKTSLTWKYGQKNVILHIGETQISNEGIIEVPDVETGRLVIAAVPDFSFVDPALNEVPLKSKVEENTLGKEAGAPLTNTVTNEEENKGGAIMTANEVDALFKNKTLPQLQGLAKESGLPDAEWVSLPKDKLKVYLKKVLTTPPVVVATNEEGSKSEEEETITPGDENTENKSTETEEESAKKTEEENKG